MFRSALRGALRLFFPLLVVVAVAEPMSAQESLSRLTLRSDLSVGDQARAELDSEQRDQTANALRLEAQQAEAEGKWRRAALRYKEAGLLRGTYDARAVADFSASARAHYNADNQRAAAGMSEMAGKKALELGEVYDAAVSFQHAAALRTEMGQKVRGQELAWRACHLSSASSLSEEDRTKIQAGLANCREELQRVAMSINN